jgi:hypothetical protein
MSTSGVVFNTFFDIPTSQPSPGAFDFTHDSVAFRSVVWQNTPGVVAFCIEQSRLADLLEGEKARGLCNLIVHDKKKAGSVKYRCSFGKLRTKAHLAKASAGPSQTEAGNRRSAIAHGDSCKRGCEFWLKYNVLPSRRGVAVIGVLLNAKGQHSEAQGSETVGVLQHTGGRGKVSEECRLWVRQALGLELTTGQIEQGAFLAFVCAHEATCLCRAVPCFQTNELKHSA